MRVTEPVYEDTMSESASSTAKETVPIFVSTLEVPVGAAIKAILDAEPAVTVMVGLAAPETLTPPIVADKVELPAAAPVNVADVPVPEILPTEVLLEV